VKVIGVRKKLLTWKNLGSSYNHIDDKRNDDYSGKMGWGKINELEYSGE